MASNRKPGPIGIGGIDPIDDGTLCRRVSHPPGPTGIQHSHGAAHRTSNRHFHPHTEIPSAKRAPSAGSLLVEYGDRGPAVEVLQKLLNVHFDPAPNLKIDGHFGPKTLAALKRYQTAQKLKADGVAGKATWYRLTYTDSRRAGRIVQPQVAVDVSTWPMSKRFVEVIRLLPGKLPHEIWNQLMGLMSTDLMVIAVGLYAASHLFGVGELIDIGIGLLVAEQGVIELADCVQTTALAMSPKDLDEAAAHLARAISIIGVFKFVSLLARFLKNRPEASNKPPDSSSKTPAPVSGKTESLKPSTSSETGSASPPRKSANPSPESTTEPKSESPAEPSQRLETEPLRAAKTPAGGKKIDPSDLSGPWAEQGKNLRSGGALAQSCGGSCVSAVGEMLTEGAVTERQLLDNIGEWSNAEALAAELNARAGADQWIGGGFGSEEDALLAAQQGPMGAVVRAPGSPGHMVLIEPAGSGIFSVRDPLPGVCYEVDEAWVRQYVAEGVWQK